MGFVVIIIINVLFFIIISNCTFLRFFFLNSIWKLRGVGGTTGDDKLGCSVEHIV
jgi:hypothetical protein